MSVCVCVRETFLKLCYLFASIMTYTAEVVSETNVVSCCLQDGGDDGETSEASSSDEDDEDKDKSKGKRKARKRAHVQVAYELEEETQPSTSKMMNLQHV